MTKVFLTALLAAPAAALAVSGSAIAAESASDPVVSFDQAPVQLAQITSVSELTDVLPSDWAFQALQSLVENYGCIQGYPDRTFRGQRSMTRFEFAAGLNACLDVMAVLISQAGLDPEDLATIRRLQEEFQAELATLRGRVDALEAETATLRAQQFSTTTKLRGQADFHIGAPFDTLDAGGIVEDSVSVASRARLNFDSSFTGRDRLRIRLQGRSGDFLTPFGGLANGGDGNFNVAIDDFYYSFPLGNRITTTIAARGLSNDDWVTSTIVPFDGPGVADPSTPAFYGAGGSTSNGAGVGINVALTDSIMLDLGYTSANSGATDPARGITAAQGQSYIAQLNFLPEGFLNAAVTYMGSDNSAPTWGGAPGRTDTFAGLLNLDFGRFFIAGYAAWTDFDGGDDFNWTAGIGFNDFLMEGAQFGVYGGQLPQTDGFLDNPWIVEGYYDIPVSQFVTLTPALIYGDANLGGPDDTTFYGVLRATFRF
ncbi:MAG: S-layer protein [Leptolyngbya sp. LCM1.Bin17]|nr:MAG: S-layer protein [Leptolyngbya sp. LCM1.Bin17]